MLSIAYHIVCMYDGVCSLLYLQILIWIWYCWHCVVTTATYKTNMSRRPRPRMGCWKPQAARDDVRSKRCKNVPRTDGST